MKTLFRKKSIDQILADVKKATELDSGNTLKKTLRARDLTAFGIAAIVGAGIFSTIGNAAFNGGPAVSLLFIFTAIACTFSALCYAEFASSIPVSGSAYTYAYVAFGELIAWIIGWDLLLEYAIGNIAVAISWSDYFTGLMSGLGWELPQYLTMDYLSALRGNKQVLQLLQEGKNLSEIPFNLTQSFYAWNNAPAIGSFRLIADIPALMIVVLITYLVYRGIKESRTATNVMVVIKLAIILLVIAIGFFYINPMNWSPFAPNGFSGIMKGVSAVFFAYIGFDAISTTAEECENPRRDMPRGIINSLVICTVLYVIIALTLTGMVNYTELGIGDPLAYVFKQVGLDWISGIIAFSAVIAMASVLLVFQMGQPRIWMSMSRDGLLPKAFSKIHAKFRTPSFATVVTGFVVAVPALFLNLTEVTDLTSIGTLFAFVLVCGGVLVLQNNPGAPESRFRVLYINGKFIVPIILLTTLIYSYYLNAEGWNNFWSNESFFFWEALKHKLPTILFIVFALVIVILTFLKNLSLIPVLGLLTCFYLMTELGYINWVRFLGWMLLGLIIYFLYGYRSSKLNKNNVNV